MSDVTTDLFAAAQRLQQRGQPFALVSVVRAQPPTSARAGDKALVTPQGIVHGWIGGGCAQPAVLHAVREALHDGCARVLRIAPAATGAEGDVQPAPDDVLEFEMSCHSGGTLELFIDPILPPMRLVIIGDSPVALALAGLAPRIGMPVTVIARGADAQHFAGADQVVDTDEASTVAARVAAGSLVVVATQGRRDLPGLRAALALKARKIWLVASARKAQVLRASLLATHDDAQAVKDIIAPAGQPIGAQTPEEIALSVLASVVAVRRAASGAGADAGAAETDSGRGPAPAPAEAITAAADEEPAGPRTRPPCCGGA